MGEQKPPTEWAVSANADSVHFRHGVARVGAALAGVNAGLHVRVIVHALTALHAGFAGVSAECTDC